MIHFLPAAAQFGLADNDDAVLGSWDCAREREPAKLHIVDYFEGIMMMMTIRMMAVVV